MDGQDYEEIDEMNREDDSDEFDDDDWLEDADDYDDEFDDYFDEDGEFDMAAYVHDQDSDFPMYY